MKKSMVLGVCLSVLSGAAFAGQDVIPGEFSTTIGFVSEYSFRGIAQSDEGPAMQGSIDWTHESGLYAGVWGSNVEFNDASIETDFYAGYTGEVSAITYDIGLIYYAYPGADNDLNYDFVEGALAVGHDYGPLAVSASVNYSPEFFADSGDATYVAGYVDVPLPFMPFETTLNASVGHQWIDDNSAYGVEDYVDYGIGLTANVEGFAVGLRYIGTDLDEPSECADGCDDRVIVSISKSLP